MDDDNDHGETQQYGDDRYSSGSQGSFDNDQYIGKYDDDFGGDGDFKTENEADEGLDVNEDIGEAPEFYEDEIRLVAGFKDIEGRKAGWSTLGTGGLETSKRRTKEERFEINLRRALAEIFDDDSADIMRYMFLFKNDPLVYNRNATLLVVAKKYIDFDGSFSKSKLSEFKKRWHEIDFTNFDIMRYVRLINRLSQSKVSSE